MWFSLVGLNRKEDFDPMSWFQISKTLTTALEDVMSVERFLLRMGARFLVGGPLLVLARPKELPTNS